MIIKNEKGALRCRAFFLWRIVDGYATMDAAFNPNGSICAIEGITSPDGRVFGKMGHTERIGKELYRNVPGQYEMELFTSAVRYFK